MGYIKQLSDDLIKKIAAGEVIERPASVVKELVENSIDANSAKIEIEIKRGGKYIKVSDNGSGIHPDDIDLLFSRHATSKITSLDDLWRVETLGFRGEALASISSVSKIKCFSKHADCESGFEASVIDGKPIKKTYRISFGTVFEIEDLFYNVPARQKFLKSESTENSHIYDVILSLALSHSDISFSLKNNEDVLLKSSGSGDLRQTIIELLGNDLKEKLISVSKTNHFCSLSGFISTLEITRTNKKSQFVFINKRPVKCHIISKAVQSVFESLLPPGKFPVVILNLDFKPKYVDVNVHPRKLEVRYTHPNDVYNLVLYATQDAISEHYKKEYKEKSVYAIPDTPTQKHTEAAFGFYTKENENEVRHCEGFLAPLGTGSAISKHSGIVPRASCGDDNESHVFSVNNLKCKIIHSEKPIANMTKIGNKTIFEAGSIFDDNVQIVFNGEITGDADYQKDFFNSISDLSKKIYENYVNSKIPIQGKLVNEDLENETVKEKGRKKPPEKLLYKVWERDNWTCVYCGKQLLDPKLVNDNVSIHSLREYMATYDHHLPVSKLPQFNFDSENLFACCIKCNQKKNDSLELNAWKPERKNSWDKPLNVANLCFSSPIGT